MVMSLVCASGADDVGSSPPSPPVLQAARAIEPPASSARILAPLCVVLKVGFLLGWGQGARSGVYRCGRRPVPDRDGTRDLPRSGVTEHQWWQGSQGRPTACYRDETDRCPTGVRAFLRRDLAVTGRPLAARRRDAAAGILTSRHLPPPEGRVPHTWDPDRYLTWADERGRPFLDLVARVDASSPGLVVDLGCGPGNLTDLLAAPVAGGAGGRGRLEPRDGGACRRSAARGCGTRWATCATGRPRPPPGSVDVLVSNATLQWVPEHLELLPALVRAVRPGGWFAFQVPGNFGEPSHVLTRALAAEEPYAEHTAGAAQPDAHGAATYLEALSALGCEVDAWETTYLHVLTGPDPVLTWISGTGARPVLEALPAGRRRPARAVRCRARRAPARGLPRARRPRRPAVPPGVRGGAGGRLTGLRVGRARRRAGPPSRRRPGASAGPCGRPRGPR